MGKPGTGCLCCEARTCLLVWSVLYLILTTVNVIVLLSTDFVNIHEAQALVNLIGCFVSVSFS